METWQGIENAMNHLQDYLIVVACGVGHQRELAAVQWVRHGSVAQHGFRVASFWQSMVIAKRYDTVVESPSSGLHCYAAMKSPIVAAPQ